MANVQILQDADHLAQTAAEEFIRLSEESIQARGMFIVALSGGSTPQMLYKLLASEPQSERVDWSRVQVFWGDERFVPTDDPENNAHKACETLLNHVPVPQENIHRIPTDKTPEQSAEAYEETLLNFFSSLPTEEERNRASFDLILLGMGDDGHTASLFPGTPAVQEQVRWVAAQYVDKLAAWRISLTPALINRARNIIFLVSGEAKSATLQRVIYGAHQPERYPAQVVQPYDGQLLWMVDEAAASLF